MKFTKTFVTSILSVRNFKHKLTLLFTKLLNLCHYQGCEIFYHCVFRRYASIDFRKNNFKVINCENRESSFEIYVPVLDKFLFFNMIFFQGFYN